jgi:uncharacterized protein (DUF1778 family)
VTTNASTAEQTAPYKPTKVLTIRCSPAEYQRIRDAAWRMRAKSLNHFALAGIMAAVESAEKTPVES